MTVTQIHPKVARKIPPHEPIPAYDQENYRSFVRAVSLTMGTSQFTAQDLATLFTVLRLVAKGRRGGLDTKALTVWLVRHQGLALENQALVRSLYGLRWMVAPASGMNAPVIMDHESLDPELDALLREE